MFNFERSRIKSVESDVWEGGGGWRSLEAFVKMLWWRHLQSLQVMDCKWFSLHHHFCKSSISVLGGRPSLKLQPKRNKHLQIITTYSTSIISLILLLKLLRIRCISLSSWSIVACRGRWRGREVEPRLSWREVSVLFDRESGIDRDTWSSHWWYYVTLSHSTASCKHSLERNVEEQMSRRWWADWCYGLT